MGGFDLDRAVATKPEFLTPEYPFEGAGTFDLEEGLSRPHRERRPRSDEADRVSNFPYEAIEEALVNAVYHRDYLTREPVEVTITGDEFTVVSYPRPDRSVRPSDLAKGRAISRRYRNRRIGEFLKELDLTEGRGTGIPKILRAMKKNGSPAPEFRTDDEHTFFATVLPIHPDAKAASPNMHGDMHGDLHGGTGQVAESVLRVVEIL